MKNAKILTCGRNAEELQKCAREWIQEGFDVTTVQADVASVDGRDHLVKEIRSWLGSNPKLDILVNNVGTNIRKPSIEYTQDDIDTVFKTNFFSMFALTVALHPLLKRQNGEYSSSVINIGSVAGVTCMKSGTPYASTKAAMNQISGTYVFMADTIKLSTS